MSEPIKDVEALVKVIWQALDGYFLDPSEKPIPDGDFVAVALAVRDAVCPPGTHVVVPRAEHDILQRLERAATDLRKANTSLGYVAPEILQMAFDRQQQCWGATMAVVDELAAYRAALGTEATE